MLKTTKTANTAKPFRTKMEKRILLRFAVNFTLKQKSLLCSQFVIILPWLGVGFTLNEKIKFFSKKVT